MSDSDSSVSGRDSPDLAMECEEEVFEDVEEQDGRVLGFLPYQFEPEADPEVGEDAAVLPAVPVPVAVQDEEEDRATDGHAVDTW